MAARVEAARAEEEAPAPAQPAVRGDGRRQLELSQFQAEFPGLVSISRVQQTEIGEEGP